MKFFSYSKHEGFALHDTAEEAKTGAQRQLNDLREEAGDGWPEEVDFISWGKVHQEAVVVSSEPTCPNGATGCDCDLLHTTAFDSVVDYALIDVTHEVSP